MENGKGYQRGYILGASASKNLTNFGAIKANEPTGLKQFAPVTLANDEAVHCVDDTAAKTTNAVVWIQDDIQIFWDSACGEYVVPQGEYVRVIDLDSILTGGAAGYVTPFAIENNPTNLTKGIFLVATSAGNWKVEATPEVSGWAYYLEITDVITDTGVGLSYQFKVVKV